MIKKVSNGFLQGTIVAPSSKSYAQRAILAASLSLGTSTLYNVGANKDTDSLLASVKELGAKVVVDDGVLQITGPVKPGNINVGESGLASRLLIPVLSLFPEESKVDGEGTLLRRDLSQILEPLSQLGVNVELNNGFLPANIKGPIIARDFSFDCSQSSQLLSGLLFALPLCDCEKIKVYPENLVSKPYVRVTTDVLSAFSVNVEENIDGTFLIRGHQSYKATNYTIEGDWSGVSTILVSPGRKTIRGLNPSSSQADRSIISVLEAAGVNYNFVGDELIVFGNSPSAFTFDATDSPDLFPALALLASRVQSGVSEIYGTSRLKNKESDRLNTIHDLFQNMGVEIDISQDNKMVINGGQTVRAASVSSCMDHRIAMVAASLALLADGMSEITFAEAVNKSYKNFWNDFNLLYHE